MSNVKRVFVAENFPATMSVKSCLTMSGELGLPDLHKYIPKQLLCQIKLVPCATTHARYINFSQSALTLLMSASMSGREINDDDAHRLVLAGTRLLADYYPSIGKRKRKQVQQKRQRLVRCVRRVVQLVWRRCRTIPRQLVSIACVVALVLAYMEGVIGPKTNISPITRKIGMSRCNIKARDIQEVVLHCDEGSEEEEEEQ